MSPVSEAGHNNGGAAVAFHGRVTGRLHLAEQSPVGAKNVEVRTRCGDGPRLVAANLSHPVDHKAYVRCDGPSDPLGLSVGRASDGRVGHRRKRGECAVGVFEQRGVRVATDLLAGARATSERRRI